jgi:phospholipid/cholesterol/gamma-HCH transport system substrate-binding protein
MRFRIKFADQIVGLFILLAILGIITALILLGANQRWFKKNYRFYTKFRSGSGLKVGMPITLKGFEIGKVDRIKLDPRTREVTMNFHIYEEYYDHIVLENSVIELAISPIGIGGGLLFYPGKPTLPPRLPLEEGSYIPSLDFTEGIEIVRQGLVEREARDDTIGALMTNVGPILEKVDTILFSVNELAVSLEAAISGDQENQLGSLLSSTDTLLTDIDRIVTGQDTGPMGNILTNVSSTTNVLEDSIVKITRDLTTLAQDLRKITGNIEEMTSLDEDNPLYRDVDAILERIKGIIGELQEFAGFITGTSPQITGILEESRSTLTKTQDVLEALKNNPLLRGGVPKVREQPTPFKGYRDEAF